MKCYIAHNRHKTILRVARGPFGSVQYRDEAIDDFFDLLAGGLPESARSLRAIGYREVLAHIQGRLDHGELEERIVIATRRYAKRQDTWFRREPDVLWLETARTEAEWTALVERAMMALSTVPGSG